MELAQCKVIDLLRDQILNWRFYDSFRTDAAALARQPRVGSRCFALGGDGEVGEVAAPRGVSIMLSGSSDPK